MRRTEGVGEEEEGGERGGGDERRRSVERRQSERGLGVSLSPFPA